LDTLEVTLDQVVKVRALAPQPLGVAWTPGVPRTRQARLSRVVGGYPF
jgi:hypothetical protein